MKRILMVFILVFSACNTPKPIPEEDTTVKNKGEKKLHHLVAVKWKEGAPLDSIEHDIYKTLGALELYVDPFYYGKNAASKRDIGFSKGATHVWYATFKSAYDRDSIYMNSPEEKQFGRKYGKWAEDLIVFDWWEGNE